MAHLMIFRDHTSTAAYSVDNVSPEATVTFGQGQDCLTPPTGVIVGDELSMCIELKPEYRQRKLVTRPSVLLTAEMN